MSTTKRVNDEPRPGSPRKSGIIWIASYPKSGNTWVRAFLYNLIRIQRGKGEQQNINELPAFAPYEVSKRYFTEILGFEPTRAEIASTRHRVQQRFAEQGDGLIFLKTHNALVMDRDYSTINVAVTAGAIYIVRNPLDVAISYADHRGGPIDAAITEMARRNAETPGNDKVVYEVPGSWSQHVESWTRNPHPALFVIRYEDMLSVPQKTFGGLVRRLLLNPTPEQLKEAIDCSSFEKLQAQEKRQGFLEKAELADRFFREGRAGQWREILTQGQIARIVRDHGAQMRRFGYLPLR
jgi:hypothetical protein